jgi:hypothetical protein
MERSHVKGRMASAHIRIANHQGLDVELGCAYRWRVLSTSKPTPETSICSTLCRPTSGEAYLRRLTA